MITVEHHSGPRGRWWTWRAEGYGSVHPHTTAEDALAHARGATLYFGESEAAIIRPSTDWRAEQAAAEERRAANQKLIEDADRSNARRAARSYALRAAEEGWA